LEKIACCNDGSGPDADRWASATGSHGHAKRTEGHERSRTSAQEAYAARSLATSCAGIQIRLEHRANGDCRATAISNHEMERGMGRQPGGRSKFSSHGFGPIQQPATESEHFQGLRSDQAVDIKNQSPLASSSRLMAVLQWYLNPGFFLLAWAASARHGLGSRASARETGDPARRALPGPARSASQDQDKTKTSIPRTSATGWAAQINDFGVMGASAVSASARTDQRLLPRRSKLAVAFPRQERQDARLPSPRPSTGPCRIGEDRFRCLPSSCGRGRSLIQEIPPGERALARQGGAGTISAGAGGSSRCRCHETAAQVSRHPDRSADTGFRDRCASDSYRQQAEAEHTTTGKDGRERSPRQGTAELPDIGIEDQLLPNNR